MRKRSVSALVASAVMVVALSPLEHAAIAGQAPVQLGGVPVPDAPLSLAVKQIHIKPEGSEIRFAVTATAAKKISTYTVSAYWYPPRGKRHGFASSVQHPPAALSKDVVHETSLQLPARAPIDVGTTVVLAVTAASFEDGTEWRPDPNRLTESVNKAAQELMAVGRQ